jgi:leucyl aminopeptidase
MELASLDGPIEKIVGDALLVGYFADEPRGEVFDAVNRLAGGLLGRLAANGDLSGKPCEVVPLFEVPGLAVKQVLACGLGRRGELSRGRVYQAVATGMRKLLAKPRKEATWLLDLPSELRATAVAAAVFAAQGQDLWRQEKKVQPIDKLQFHGWTAAEVEQGRPLGESVNLTRRLIDSPPDVIYPETFAYEAARVAKECGLECEIWDQARLEQERCGSLLAVAKGSSRPPRLVILRYRGARKEKPDLALVGKGVTFDSGGLSLKPSDSMLTMKCDMAGAATVLGAMRAIALARPAVDVIGLMGLVENMPGPGAMKLGDVLTARSGKTIEVHNTDAEGRLVLADVLAVAVESGAARLVDLATLTGSCVVALGRDVAGLMANDQAWCDRVSAAANQCGEAVWQLPMFKEYDELIESPVADIKNVGDSRWGGAITAAKFLEQFVANVPWVHMDIAGPAYAEKSKPWLDGGATGAYVRTLVELATHL